ncbi:MAG: hypothetical protein C4521_08745 [Actinobacteria bacterium]|nr:MAG: hypothetical protein C4521_08745 [Actinomycetota bacterium]
MTFRRALIGALAATLAVVIFITGCSVVQGEVAAVVNGENIYAKEVDEQFTQMQGQHDTFEGKQGKQMEKQFKQRILDKLISDKLVEQEAEKLGVSPDQKEVDQRFEQLKKQFSSEAQFNDALQKAKLTPDKLKESIAQQLIVQKLMTKLVKNQKVTDKEIADYYKKNKAQFLQPEKYRVSHVLVKPTDKKVADKVYSQLSGGASFATVAKKYSIDPQSKTKGGDIGFVSVGEVVPEFGSAMSKLKIGQLSKPVKSQFGWHVLKVTAKRKAGQRTLAEVKDQISQTIVQTRQRDVFNKWLADAKKKAKIEDKKLYK